MTSAGDGVEAITDWNGSEYVFNFQDGGEYGAASETGAFDSANSTADEIVEKPTTYLSNFGSFYMAGYNGQGESPISAHPYTEVTLDPGQGTYDTVGALSSESFSITQNHCNGS